MTKTNKTRIVLLVLLTALLVASLIGTTMMASAFTVDTTYGITVEYRSDTLSISDATKTSGYSSYAVSNDPNSTWIAINGQVYQNADVASSFTVNELRIAAIGLWCDCDDCVYDTYLVFRESSSSQWYRVNCETEGYSERITTPLVITTAGTYIFYSASTESNNRSAYLTITVDPTLGQVSAPAKTGKVFTGWYIDSACTTLYTGQVITSDTVLYAGYRAVEFDIVYDANGGTGTHAGEHIVYDGWNVVSMTTTFTKTGYHLAGWEDEFGNEYYPSEDEEYDTYFECYDDGTTVTLYAIWEANTYSVKFNGNGSTSGSMSNQSFTYDVAQSLTTNAFKRTYTVTYNYNGNGSANTTATATATFNGWATSASGAKVYSDKQSVSNLATTGTFNLYANWTLGKVTLPTPTRTGYTFAGWYTAASGGTKVGAGGASYTPEEEITLYAQWTANTYTVTFNGNGSTSGSMSNQTFTYDVAQNLTANAFKRVYTVTYNYNGNGSANTTATATATFNGWATSATGSVVYTNSQSVSNLATTGTFNLYANWTLGKVTLPTPTRTGYTFAGWYTAASGGTKVGAGGASYTPEEEITLYAQWTANTYTVTFNGNGGTSPSSITVTYDGTYGTLPTSTKTGYVFLGWFTSASGGTQVTSSTKVAITSAQTLYAHWRGNEFTVTFNANGGTGTMESVTYVYDGYNTVPSCSFTREGYEFSHWVDQYGTTYVEDTSSDAEDLLFGVYDDGEEVELSAVWSANSYSVKFNGNGSTSGSMSNQTFTYDVAQNLTANAFKRAYTVTYNYNGNGFANTTATATATFNGWATSASGAKVYNDQQSVSNLTSTAYAVVDLYANWTLGKVTLPTPTRDGYTFNGWYTAASGGTKVGVGGASYTPSSAITLYAQWTASNYTVVFNANGGTGTMASQGFTYDKAQALSANEFSKTGYHFVGWSESATATTATYTDEQSVTNLAGTATSITLYAIWEANTYTVVFDSYAAGGTTDVTGTTASMSMTYDVGKTVSTNGFTREGYTFLGWSTTAGGSVEYMEGDSLKNLTTTNNGTVTLYAVWQINRYSVTFVDGETGETIAVVVVDWGTKSEDVIASAVNTVLYEVEDEESLPNA